MWILLFLLFASLTPVIDLWIAGFFYTPGSGFYDNAFFHALFKYGELFGLATGVLACIFFLLSFFNVRWKSWRPRALSIILTLILGAGLITNSFFKTFWGRPRPKQIVEFGGNHLYRPFWNPDFYNRDEPQKSFPSGHVAMGFYFISMYRVGKRSDSRFLRAVGLFLTIFLGVGLMVARVAQGGHFVSDVIASAILMWYISKWIDRLIFDRNKLYSWLMR